MEPTYRKSKGNAGQKGVQFQLDLITMCLLNALRRNNNWKISSENPMAGKYDDIVVELAGETAVLIQAKHKENRRITKNQLMSDNSKNSDFSLPKYFFSYEEVKSKFPVRTVVICTNTAVNTKDLEDMLTLQQAQPDSVLYHENDCSFYSFNENMLPELKESAEAYLSNNTRNNVAKTVVTEENLKDFLRNLQIFSCYPSEDSLHKIIEQSLSRLNYSSLCRNISSQEILKKVEDWFLQPKGEYLTEARAKAMLCEIRSDKYSESLKDYNVSFGSNDLDITSSKGIIHIKVKGGNLLAVLKIYCALQGDKSRQLYVNPEDALEVQKHVVEAFSLRRYKSLIVSWPTIEDVTEKREIINTVRRILEEDNYKQVILVADIDVELAQRLELEDICQVDGHIMFQDLSDDFQQKLLETNDVLFQGQRITLRELLHTQGAEDCTKFLDSEMLEELVKGKEIKVGVRPLDLEEDSAQYYVSRRFQIKLDVETEDIPTFLSEETLYDATEKMVVISDSAGMGKSTVIIKMAMNIKKANPSLWVMKINLNDYSRVFKDFARMKRSRINATELLNSLEATRMTNKFEKLVFSMSGKVVLLLDGVDEISPDYTDLLLSLLSYCKGASNFAKIFITTRPHMQLKLEGIELFQMPPLTKMEQTHFLTNFWMHNLHLNHENKERCKRYAEILIEKISSWAISKHGQNPFTDIPLQIRMLAEIFQENIKRQQSPNWEGCKEYLERDGIELKLPEKFNIAELYDTFIEKKQEVFIDKENPYGSGIVSLALLNQFKTYLAYLRSLAVSAVLPEYKHLFTTLTPEDKVTEEYILKIGIVQRLDGRLHFIHRTFAEYFAAHSIIQELKQNPHAKFQQLVIDTILACNRYKIILDFLDIMLQAVTLPPEIFKEYRSLKSDSNPYLIFQLATAGYVEIVRFILDTLHFEIIEGRHTKTWRLRKPFRKKNTLNDLEVLFWEAGLNIKSEEGETLLHHAVQGGNLEMVHFLVKKGADVNMKSSVFPSHVTSHWRIWNAAKLVLNRSTFKSTYNQGLAALHFAVRSNQIDIVEYLLKHGADVNLKGSLDDTALHTAAYKGNLNVIKCLVEHGADVNAGGDEGLTALHIAAMFNRIDAVEYLLQHGADLTLKNSERRMRVYLTARCQQLISMSSKK